MRQYFLQSWRKAELDYLKEHGPYASFFCRSIGSQFRSLGVQPGDFLYVVAGNHGEVFLIGRMDVKEVKKDRCIGRRRFSTGYHADLRLPASIVRKLQFLGRKPRLNVIGDEPYRIDPQSLRRMRRLTPESAAILDDCLESPLSAQESPNAHRLEPDELDFAEEEGRVRLRLHKIRERDPALVKRKKAEAMRLYGALKCEICGFDFHETYGPLGQGFIECHHVVPLSQRQAPSRTRLRDLSLVCANCHRILHRASCTMQELRSLVNAAKPLSARWT